MDSPPSPASQTHPTLADPPASALEFWEAGRSLPNGTPLLREASFSLSRGETLVLVGPSGAGKSTLLRLANRLDECTQGEISVLGRDLKAWPVLELRRRVALVFQEPNLLGLTVRENLLLPFAYRNGPLTGLKARKIPVLEARLAPALEEFGLEPGMLERREGDLSGGQKQRVCLARALMGDPEILLLDEPTAALDPPTANMVLKRLRERVVEGGLTVVLGTHRIEEALVLGGGMGVLLGGRIEALGPAGALLAHPPPGPVAAFLSESRAAKERAASNDTAATGTEEAP